MARLRFEDNRRFVWSEQVYIVRGRLTGGRIQLSNLTCGSERIADEYELVRAWGRGEIKFEVLGPHSRHERDQPLATEYTVADLQDIPEKYRREVWRRYQLLLPLLQLPQYQRTRRAIMDHYPPQAIPVDNLDGERNKRRRALLGQATSWASVERWLRDFERSGNDPRALIPRSGQGGKGKARLDPEVEAIVQRVLDDCKAARAPRTVDDVRALVINRVADDNRTRPAGAPRLALPSNSTIRRRVLAVGANVILRRSPSRLEEQAEHEVRPGPRPTRILERVEVDHTVLDLVVVDEEDRLPIGRPTLTIGIDKYSGYPWGIYVGFEPPSYMSVMNCLLHGILPKADAHALYGTTHPWEAYGVPEVIMVDNGKEFTGGDLEDACLQLGVTLLRSPVRSPWFKGSIERFFRSLNTQLVHPLPGSTFSNVVERGDYDSSRHACISLGALQRLLHVFILDIYAQQWHRGVEDRPETRWRESVHQGHIPALHCSADEVRMLLLRTEARTVQRTGIEFESLKYSSPDLPLLRSSLGRGEHVRIKYDPADLGSIYVRYPPAPGGWLRMQATNQEYAHGLSLWKHRVIRHDVRKRQHEVDIVALAAAKRRIQEIVEDEFDAGLTHSRQRLARYLTIGTAPLPTSGVSPSPDSGLPSSSGALDLATHPAEIRLFATSVRDEVGASRGNPAPCRPPSDFARERAARSPGVSPSSTEGAAASSAPARAGPSQEPDRDDDAPDEAGWSGNYALPNRDISRL